MTVAAESLFEAAAAALAMFKHEGWAVEALTPNAILTMEVHTPPIVHAVPLKAVESWLGSPEHESTEAREMMTKRKSRT